LAIWPAVRPFDLRVSAELGRVLAYGLFMTQRCALWVRVSKDEQETGNQLDQLQAWAHRRGLEVAAAFQLDGASAWTGAHRDQLRHALDGARLPRGRPMSTG
jgi:Resolvase, N terminal domain